MQASISCQPASEWQARQTVRQLLYEEVRGLHERGMTITDIGRKTGLDRKTVRKYIQVEKLPGIDPNIWGSPSLPVLSNTPG